MLSMGKVFRGFLLIVSSPVFLNTVSFAEGVSEDPQSLPDSANRRPSDSPFLRLPAPALQLRPIIVPAQRTETVAENSNDAVSFNLATQQESRIPAEAEALQQLRALSGATPAYEGVSGQGLAVLPSDGDTVGDSKSVLGVDGRVQISPATTYPWRTIARLQINYPNSGGWGCSGAIIDNFHILTAGHCVHSASEGGWATSIVAYPGQDGNTIPYYLANAVFMKSYTGWTLDQNPEHDWAVIQLDRNIGAFTGWMGRVTWDASDTAYTGIANISGYPCDKPGGTQWFDFDNGSSASEYKHHYFVDTFGCQSGSPVWRYAEGQRNIMAVHAYGSGGGSTNSGTRLNADKFNAITTWLAEDTPPVDKPDLVDDGATYFGFSPATISTGNTFNIYNDVRNLGTGNSSGFYVSYYASTDTTITTEDYHLGDVWVSGVNAFDSVTTGWNGSLPGIPSGNYYIGWIIDRTATNAEFSELNNVAYNATPVTVLAACTGENLQVNNIIYVSGDTVTCTGTNSLQAGPGVVVQNGADVTFQSPLIQINPGFQVMNGGNFQATTTITGCIDPTDTDNDRLPDCVETNTGVFVDETNTGTNPLVADTDGDAIDDGDEVLGTLGGLDLPAMNANPLRKNIFIEYDWFDDSLDCSAHSHRPTVAALNRVAAAFAAAPVSNPDGTTGITMIQDYGQGGQFSGGNHIPDANGVLAGTVFGTEFRAYKASNFATNRYGYFRYVILPHRYNTTSGSSGYAELPGDDFIVSLYCAGSDRNVSHTIMHELGHNLNLRHGGFENRNWKPNYNSIMNYKYQFPGTDSCADADPDGNSVLDYSVGSRINLNETALNENLGTCGTLAWDWNSNSVFESSVTEDINCDNSDVCDGQLSVLQDSDDWSNIIFTGLSNANGVPITRLPQESVECNNPAPLR